AEDGIRDFHVTGVQTCALPISPRNGSASAHSSTGGPPCSTAPRRSASRSPRRRRSSRSPSCSTSPWTLSPQRSAPPCSPRCAPRSSARTASSCSRPRVPKSRRWPEGRCTSSACASRSASRRLRCPRAAPMGSRRVSELPRRHAASWFVAPAAVAVGVLLVGALARVLAPGARTFADTVGEASLGPLGRLPWDWLPLLGAQLAFVAVALAIEVPVGLVLARALPRRGVGATAAVALLAWPLLVPAAVAGLLAAE